MSLRQSQPTSPDAFFIFRQKLLVATVLHRTQRIWNHLHLVYKPSAVRSITAPIQPTPAKRVCRDLQDLLPVHLRHLRPLSQVCPC